MNFVPDILLDEIQINEEIRQPINVESTNEDFVNGKSIMAEKQVKNILRRIGYETINALDIDDRQNPSLICRLELENQAQRVSSLRRPRINVSDETITRLVRAFLVENWKRIELKNLRSGIIRTEPIDD